MTASVNLASAYGFLPTATAATNTTALNSAITDSSNGTKPPVIQLDAGTFNLNALATIAGDSVVLQGSGGFNNGTKLVFNNATGDCITFSTNGHMGIRDCYLTANVNRTGGYAVKFTGSCFKPHMERVRIDYHFDAVFFDKCSEPILNNITFRYLLGGAGLVVGGGAASLVSGWRIYGLDADNPYPQNNNGTRKTWAVSTAFSLGDIVHTNGNIYNCTTAGTSAASGSGPSGIPGTVGSDAFTTGITDGTVTWKFVCSDNIAWILVDSFGYSGMIAGATLIDGAYGILTRDTQNTGSSWPKWLQGFDVECDHNYFGGVAANNGEGLYLDNSWIGSCLTGNGVTINTNHQGEAILRGCRIVGHWQHGVLLQKGPADCMVQGCNIYQNSQQASATYHGMMVAAGAFLFQINNNNSGNGPSGPGQQGWGIMVATGNSDNYTIVGNLVEGNVTGAISDGGTGVNKVVGSNAA